MSARKLLINSAIFVAALTAPAAALDAVSSCLNTYGDTVAYEWHYRDIAGKHCWYPTPRSTKAYKPIAHIHHMWTGPFAGAQAGYGFSTIRVDPTGFHPGAIAIAMPENVNPTDFLLGPEIGYRWRTDKWMTGAELEADYTNVRGIDWHALTASRINWTAAANFLFGYVPTPDWLVYAGLGPAMSNKTTIDLLTAQTTSKNVMGADFEIGVQYAIAPNVATGAKYQIIETGKNNITQAIKWNVDVDLPHVTDKWITLPVTEEKP